MLRRNRGLTCMEVFAVVVVAVVLFVLLTPLLRHAQSRSRYTGCSNNLAQMWKMMGNYMVQHGGPQKRLPSETGKEFWLKLNRPPTVHIDATLADIYSCPAAEPAPAGDTTYRGPAWDVNAASFGDRDPVGADIAGNHEDGGGVILKSGDVATVSSVDPLWHRAARTTAGGPAFTGKVPVEPDRELGWWFWIGSGMLGVLLLVRPLRGWFWPDSGPPRALAYWSAVLGLAVLLGIRWFTG